MPRLRHVDCAGPGLTRRRRGSGFSYLDERGRPIREPETLERIRALAIPPAWVDVWICPAANGHLQAVGTDEAGVASTCTTPRGASIATARSSMRCSASARRCRRRGAESDGCSREPDLSRDRVLAFAVALLDRGLFRVGGEEYANDYGSHGLATLERRHVSLFGRDGVAFAFEGKSGRFHELEVSGRPLRRAASDCSRPAAEAGSSRTATDAAGTRCGRRT